eukprot:scaffold1373_cov367-Pinguiococcus_pyrenoidosus.AAC.4
MSTVDSVPTTAVNRKADSSAPMHRSRFLASKLGGDVIVGARRGSKGCVAKKFVRLWPTANSAANAKVNTLVHGTKAACARAPPPAVWPTQAVSMSLKAGSMSVQPSVGRLRRSNLANSRLSRDSWAVSGASATARARDTLRRRGVARRLRACDSRNSASRSKRRRIGNIAARTPPPLHAGLALRSAGPTKPHTATAAQKSLGRSADTKDTSPHPQVSRSQEMRETRPSRNAAREIHCRHQGGFRSSDAHGAYRSGWLGRRKRRKGQRGGSAKRWMPNSRELPRSTDVLGSSPQPEEEAMGKAVRSGHYSTSGIFRGPLRRSVGSEIEDFFKIVQNSNVVFAPFWRNQMDHLPSTKSTSVLREQHNYVLPWRLFQHNHQKVPRNAQNPSSVRITSLRWEHKRESPLESRGLPSFRSSDGRFDELLRSRTRFARNASSQGDERHKATSTWSFTWSFHRVRAVNGGKESMATALSTIRRLADLRSAPGKSSVRRPRESTAGTERELGTSD